MTAIIRAESIPTELLVNAGLGRITVKRGEQVENVWLFEYPRYRPTVWCANQGCHVPYAADLDACPECGTATLKPGEYGDPGEGRR